VSTQVLQRMYRSVLERQSPRSTVADGHCAYRAVSLALYGTQDFHAYVRTLAATEMLTHREVYDATSSSMAVTDNRILMSPFQTLVQHTVTDVGTLNLFICMLSVPH